MEEMQELEEQNHLKGKIIQQEEENISVADDGKTGKRNSLWRQEQEVLIPCNKK